MRPDAASAYHTRTWLLWTIATGLAALLTRNPFYLLIILIAARVVDMAVELHQRTSDPADAASDPRRSGWRFFVRLGITFAVIGAVFNALGAHIGDTVLVRLPVEWPLVGGPITVEGFAFGALNGFSLVTLLIVVATFSNGADTYAMLRGTPPFLNQTGVITSIGLAYVPQTLARAVEIREAQMLRGHRFRSARDMLPLAVPLLAGGLERSLQLAEAMESRGYSRDSSKRNPAQLRRENTIVRSLLVLGTLALPLGGFFALFARRDVWWGILLIVAGVALIGVALYLLSRHSQRTRYRRQLWRPRDSAATAALILALVLLITTWLLSPAQFAYSPYPVLNWPDFQLPIAFALALLVAPAVPLLLGKT